MIKDGKEYPTTHSMSTAWYIVDDDGNVGIIDYNENGPVPWGVEQTGIDELIWGHEENYKLKERIKFNLTEEQIYEAVGKPLKPQECDYWLDIAIRIDINRQDEFDKLSENEDFEIDVCISKVLGFYKIDTYKSVFNDDDSDSWEKLRHDSTFKKMIDKDLILEVFKLSEFDIFDNYDDKTEDYIYTKNFDTIPYFVYRQPYSTMQLIKKICTPRHPIKIGQIPELFRYRLHHIPGNFNDIQQFQVAQYHPCESSRFNSVFYNNCIYTLLPKSKSEMAYFLEEDDSIPVYSNNKLSDVFFTIEPTVMFMTSENYERHYDFYVKTDFVIHKSFWIYFKDNFSKYESLFIDVFNEFKPHVIILRDDIVEEFTSSYNIDNHIININNEQIPVYMFSELETFREEITALAKMPYRGKKYRLEISEEEMNQLIKEGKAKYND